MVLLVFRHLRLQPEDVGQIFSGRQIVREYSSDGVGVAEVDVAVAEPGRHHHLCGVDDPVGCDSAELRGLSHPGYPLAFDQDGAVLDDAPLGIHGQDEPGPVDLQRTGAHRTHLRTTG